MREISAGPLTVREAILEETPSGHHAYSIRSVIPVFDHRADVWLRVDPAGTAITWCTVFVPKIPGTGRMLAIGLRLGVGLLARALIAAAEAESAG